LEKLSEMQIDGTGTVMQNWLHKVYIPKKKDIKKKMVERGTSHVMNQEGQVLVAWKDNKAIYVASNKYTAETTFACRQIYCTTLPMQIPVSPPPPQMILVYLFIFHSIGSSAESSGRTLLCLSQQ
jgi:hypothetical protein